MKNRSFWNRSNSIVLFNC